VIVDSHQHAFWYGRTDAGLIADLDEQKIDVAWVLTWEIPPDEAFIDQSIFNPALVRADGTHPGMTLGDALVMRNHYPDRVILGYCPDPRLPGATGLLEAAVKMHGVRVCGEWKFRILLDDPRCINLFRTAGKLGCPVVFHIDVPYLPDKTGQIVYYKDWYAGTVENLERTLAACPETIFIGHAPGFWRHISGDGDTHPDGYPRGPIIPGGKVPLLMRKYPNLWADLSAGSGLYALQRNPEFGKAFLTEFADRLLFGRDFFGGELHAFLQTLDLSADVHDRIYFQNAIRLAGLPGQDRPRPPKSKE